MKIRSRPAFVLASLLVLGACDEPTAAPLDQAQLAVVGAAADAQLSDLLKQVRRATARFHSIEQAIEAGYIPAEHCVSSPAGGMGMHWAHRDPLGTTYDPLRPQLLLYEPRPNGQPKLVAVEYIVRDVGQAHPTFGGRLFDIRGTPNPAPHWSLHVWLYRDNPNGLFTPFNPTVSCQ